VGYGASHREVHNISIGSWSVGDTIKLTATLDSNNNNSTTVSSIKLRRITDIDIFFEGGVVAPQ